jgi:hypothetical protein
MMKKYIISLAATLLFGATVVSFNAANMEQTDKPAREENMESSTVTETYGSVDNDIKEIWQKDATVCTPWDASLTEGTGERDEGTEGTDKEEKQKNNKENTENSMPEKVESSVLNNLIPSDSDKEKKQYRALKNSLFLDYDNCGVKKIVTELKEGGTFIAEDLGSWLKAQDVYDITVAEDNGDYKKLYYESNQENQDKEKFYPAEDTAAIHFDWLVYEGDVITCTDTCYEEVTSVEPDGSFYTEYTLNWFPADE